MFAFAYTNAVCLIICGVLVLATLIYLVEATCSYFKQKIVGVWNKYSGNPLVGIIKIVFMLLRMACAFVVLTFVAVVGAMRYFGH